MMGTARDPFSGIPAGSSRRLRRALGMGLLMAAGWLGCQHHPTHEQVRAYDAQLLKVLGKAKQPDIIALLGQPQVRDVIGEIEVWMYQFSDNGEPVRGRPEVAMVAPDRDELILSFDRDQTLQSYHVVIEGRKTRRGKN